MKLSWYSECSNNNLLSFDIIICLSEMNSQGIINKKKILIIMGFVAEFNVSQRTQFLDGSGYGEWESTISIQIS